MRARTAKTLGLGLLALGALPLVGDAAIPVPPASKAACCNVADTPPPPDPTGDELFFNIPGGVPNVMLLMDTSGSMLELPRDVIYPTAWPASNGTCDRTWLTANSPKDTLGNPTATWLNDFTPLRSATPFDNGYNTGTMVDDPPWGQARCEAKQPRPAGDQAADWCFFRADSYYKFTGANSGTGGTFWSDNVARVYNANPCGAIATNGTLLTDYLGNVVQANDLAECQACLNSAGFYLMRPRYQTSATGFTNATAQVVFKGDFLNAFPPKFVAARKVVKDIVKIDAMAGAPTDSVRFGLTTFVTSNSGGFATALRTSGGNLRDGGQLIVPLGPDCDAAFPTTVPPSPAVVQARQALVDAVNAIDATWDPLIDFAGSTPLSEALFNIGQYFSNTGSSALYTSLFGARWVHPSFNETAAGTINAPWTAAGRNQRSFCWACQQSSTVVITDGAPNNDSNIPTSGVTTAHATFNNDFRYWSNTTIDCPACKCDLSYGGTGTGCSTPTPLVPSSGDIPNTLHKVAYFLNQTDLRPDLLNGSRTQNVAVYTISFGIPDFTTSADDIAGLAVLRKTAALGGGIFANTSSGSELATALNVAVSDVVKKTTSFSSANANSLQTSKTTSADAYLGRFRPTNGTFWEGHLFAAQIFDEFGQGCDERFPTAGQALSRCGIYADRNPNIDGDESAAGKALCRSSYVIDQDCDPIVEDSNGGFKKATFDPTTHQLLSTPDDANLFWDAGRVLSDPSRPGYRSADENANNRRTIYTVIDVNGDGKLTATDGLVEFTADNAAAIAPMMDLPVTSADPTAWTCGKWLNQIGVCGNAPLPACPAAAASVRTLCAKHLIYLFRGWDVTDADQDHCAGPGNWYNTNPWGACTTSAQCGTAATCTGGKCVTTGCPNGEERDRVNDSRALSSQEFWKLGDVFHSSPVLVKPPLDKILCGFGRENQCILTLYSGKGQSASTATPLEQYGTRDAYDEWRRVIGQRRQVVVVGANDSMFHAFDAGVPDTSQAQNPDGTYPYTNGTGAETWAFVPPDQLPRLRQALDRHTYGVDGNTMVRDVWVDHDGDGRKQRGEYHTVAVMTERGGGSRYTALDITDPDRPAFLWTFPEPCTEDAKLVGQSWSDFLPKPPPIGPVRLKVGVGAGNDPLARGFEERWVTMLNGGYDPALVRGRAVWMVDVWTGRPLWRFTDADFKAMRGDSKASMFPVAASIGMVDIGEAASGSGTPDTDAFFDTATWGDLGGNLFVARFHEPGELDATTGLVRNWFAARAFEENRQANDTQPTGGRGEFFNMTSNFLDGPSRLLSLTGSANREQLLKQGHRCGPDNVMGCCASGCTVTSTTSSTAYGAGSCSMGGTFQCTGGLLSYAPAATSSCAGSFSCGPVDTAVTFTFDCGAAGAPPPMTARLTCGADGVCTTRQTVSSTYDFPTASLARPLPEYRFFGVWAYGAASSRLFKDVAGARAFDGNRFTDVALSGCADTPGGTCKLVETSPAQVQDVGAGLTTSCRGGFSKCSATTEDPGWMYSYGKFCPLESCSPPTWTDERTGSGSLVALGCVGWSGFRPTGAAASNDPCTSSAGSPTSLAYRVDARAGVPRKGCGVEDTTPTLAYYAAQQRNAFAPPQNASMRIVVNDKGQVNYSTLKIETGTPAEKTSLGTRSSISDPLYWLEVPRVLHECRHVDPSTCQ
jgi:type IV pilus assembly protein PilY1